MRDPHVWRRVLAGVADAFERAALDPARSWRRRWSGPAGNVEFLVLAERGAHAAELAVDAAVADGEEVRRG